jgi:ABC-type multidrug transport system ATPase subunit
MLLDEPLSGLDANEASHLAQALRRTVDDEGISMLLVEHDVAMVLSLSSHIFVLDFGQLIAQGSPEVVRNDAAVKAAYLGDDPGGELGTGDDELPPAVDDASKVDDAGQVADAPAAADDADKVADPSAAAVDGRQDAVLPDAGAEVATPK